MIQVAAKGPVIQGADFYHGDAVQNFTPNAFVFLKADQGVSMTDPKFTARWADLLNDGIPRGAYHFYDPDADPVAQAQHFRNVVGNLLASDLPPVLDIETMGNSSGQAVGLAVVAYIAAITSLFKRTPIIYGSPYFLESLGFAPGITNPLWVADYGSNPPRVPSPWTDWAFWQYTEDGVDKNYFNGSAEDLQAFIRNSVAS
jgi:lysozyme